MQGSRLKKKKLETVRHRYHLTPSEDIVDLRILKSDWTRGTPDITQSAEMLLSWDATFPWWLSPHKKSKTFILSNAHKIVERINADERIVQSDWTRGTHRPHTTKSGSPSDASFPWWLTSHRKF